MFRKEQTSGWARHVAGLVVPAQRIGRDFHIKCGLAKARGRLAGSVAILALSVGAAMAQETAVEQVVVTSTRLQNTDFDAPTPTTVVSAADLVAAGKPSVFEAITQLPELMGSTGVTYNTANTSNGLMGLSALGLRGLSPIRTLVLLDGQRVVPANLNGVDDVSLFPQMLIQRVDVVTGGASASWGSDAVAGVINFVTQKKYEGFKMNAMAGESTYGDMGTVTFQAAAGTGFLGGRAHYEVAAEYSYNDGLEPRYPTSNAVGPYPEDIGGRKLWRLSNTVNFAAPNASGTSNQTTCTGSALQGCGVGQPQYFYGPLYQNPAGYPYGEITSGPKAGTAIGNNGQTFQLQLAGACAGQLVNSVGGQTPGSFNNSCFGTPSQPGDRTQSFVSGILDPLTRGNIYQRLSYDLSQNTEIYATVNWAESRTQTTPAPGGNGITRPVACDNAFLPQTTIFGANLSAAQTQAACLALYPGNSFNIGESWNNFPVDEQVVMLRSQRRYVGGGDGAFDMLGKTWSWSSYFEHGESDMSLFVHNNLLSKNGMATLSGTSIIIAPNSSRMLLAQDAVFNGSGQIVCRNASAQANGCEPLNPFLGSASPAPGALQYVLGENGANGSGTNNSQAAGSSAIQTERQDAFSLSFSGSPIDDWAGQITVAAGYEYREENYTQRGDPYGAGISASTPATLAEPCTDPAIICGFGAIGNNGGAWVAGDYHNGQGTYHVNEVFVEFGVPLINNPLWGKADLDLAARHARYNTAGDANTWKVGLTWDTPIPGIRLRALQSRDIRAPSLQEIAPPFTGVNTSVNDDFVPGVTINSILGATIGNPFLKPERALTTEVGTVWQPDFIPGFQTSFDYYRIYIAGYSLQLSPQQVMDECFGGQTQFCQQNFITTANGVNISAAAPGGALNGVIVPSEIVIVSSAPFNAASVVTDGFDIESSYQFDLQNFDVPGQFNLRSLASHVSKFITNDGNIPGVMINQESAGVINSNRSSGAAASAYGASGGTVFTWKLDETQSYQNDVWGFDLAERWFAGGTSQLKNFLVCAPGTCPAPTIQRPTINYDKVDAAFYMDVGANWYLNKSSQLYVKVDNVGDLMPPDNGLQTAANDVYDVIGRMYRVGVRFNF
ncbi:MAG TPA: TonB-dependent receptor [Rhizomicrobium sp.]|nr:TonB-dependent receptor [Rhizomicrobium sp.]